MARTRDNSGTDPKKESSSSRKNSFGKKKNGSSGFWPCTINGCTKQFAREADLKRHQRTTKLHATSVAGSQCPQCEATFTRTDALRRHQKSRHNGVVIEPDYELVNEERVDDSEDEDDTSTERHSGYSRSPPPPTSSTRVSTRRAVATKSSSSRKTNSVESVESSSPSYYSPANRGVATPRAIMTPQQYAQITHPTSSARHTPSARWPSRSKYEQESDGSSSGDDSISTSSHPTSRHAYPQQYYPNHASSAPSTHPYWNAMYPVDHKDPGSPRSRRIHNSTNHWRTSSQRSTAAMDDRSEREMSRSPSEEPGPSAPPTSSSSGGGDELQAIALALSANALRNIQQTNPGMVPSSSSSSSRSPPSRAEEHTSTSYMSSYSNRYLEQAPSLRTTQIYYTPHIHTSCPQPPRHPDSATRSTFSVEEDCASSMEFDEDVVGSPHFRYIDSKPNDVPPTSPFVPPSRPPMSITSPPRLPMNPVHHMDNAENPRMSPVELLSRAN